MIIPTTICYIRNAKDQYLLLHRIKKKEDINAGKWIGVGGKIEKDETPDQCVRREVFEETGLRPKKFFCHGVVKFISDRYDDEDMYLYSAWDVEEDLIECNEGELKWVDRDEVLNYPTWEGDYYFLKPLLEGRKKIDMIVEYKGDELVRCEDITEDVVTLKSSLIDCPHGFSTRTGGVSDGIFASLNLGMNRGDDKLRVIENWNRFLDSAGINSREFVCGEQVHKNNVHIATKDDLRPAYGPGEMNVCDGYVTNLKDVPLAIFIADCVPVLLYDREHKVIGAVHCGWRSTVADIQKNAVDKMVTLGSKEKDIAAAIGPAIGKCCFEVGVEVIQAVNELLKGDAASFYTKKGEKYLLDLRGVVKQRFIELGLKEENIELVGECTMCHPDRYWSHRYTKGERGSMAAVIALQD